MVKAFDDLQVGDTFMADGEKYLVSGIGEIHGERVVFSSPSFGENGPYFSDDFYAFTDEDIDPVLARETLQRMTKDKLIDHIVRLQDSM